MFIQWRLIKQLRRIANYIGRSDQSARAAEIVSVANLVAEKPDLASRRALALYEGTSSLDRLVLSFNGRAFRNPGHERKEALLYHRCLWLAYELALTLWHRTKKVSPLTGIKNVEPVQKLADYGGGNQVWRKGREFVLRFDVGSHISAWRDEKISRKEAEQAILSSDHFRHLVTQIQHKLAKRGQNPNLGSASPLPDPS